MKTINRRQVDSSFRQREEITCCLGKISPPYNSLMGTPLPPYSLFFQMVPP